MGSDQLIPALLSLSPNSSDAEAILETREKIFTRDYFPSLAPFPDATRLVREFVKRGLKVTVASSSSEKDLKKFLRLLNIEDLIVAETSADDADHSKPSPDLIEAALGKLGLKSGRVVMLGDTPYDVLAAKRAGVKTIAFRCGGWNDRALSGCAEIYDGPSDLLARLDHSFLFRMPEAKKENELLHQPVI